MKKINSMLLAGVMMLGVTATVQAEPVNLSVAAATNKVIDEDVAVVQASTELSNFEVGVASEFDEDTMYTYGAFVGVPLRIQGTDVVLTPRLTVDKFRKQGETLYGAGAKLSYVVLPGFTIDGLYTYRGSFDDDVDLDGDTYAVGITKTF